MNATALQAVFQFFSELTPDAETAIAAAKASGLTLPNILPTSISEFATEVQIGEQLFPYVKPLLAGLLAAKTVPPKSPV